MRDDEELVTIRLRKNTWYRAILLDDEYLEEELPREYRRHSMYVRISHNEYSFNPDEGGVFRLLSTNLTGISPDGPDSRVLPLVVSSDSVRILEEHEGEPGKFHIGHIRKPFGGQIK